MTSAPMQDADYDIDFQSQPFLENPYAIYARLRTERPVARVRSLNACFLTRYDDVKRVALDDNFRIDFERLQINRMGPDVIDQPFYKFGREFMAFADPPHHTDLKKLFLKGFTRSRAEAHIPVMRAIVDEVIDEFIADRQVDIASRFAHEVPLRIISGILGVPKEDQATLEGWVRDYNPVIGFPPMSGDQARKANDATLGLSAYFKTALQSRTARRNEDLIGELLQFNEASDTVLDEFQVVANLILLYFAGQDTQKNHLGNILVALYRNPEQLDWLRTDLSRAWTCGNELMRYDSVSQITGRVAMQDVEMHGTLIPAGRTVLLGVGAANRDPSMFVNPDSLETAGQAEIQRLERAIVGAQADAQSARESDQEAQKRAARSEDARRAFEAETRKELDQLQKSLAQAEAKLVSANEKVEQLGDGVRRAETESARLRQEREELQVRVAKAEAGLAAAQAEVQKTAQALERAQEGERRARDETAELRGQLKAGDDKGKK